MPKFFKLLRSHNKRNSNSSSSSSLKKKKSNGIFRTNADDNRSKKFTTPTIEAAITYSLSEDDESCDIILSPHSDIESQVHELKGESIIESVTFQEPVIKYQPSETATATTKVKSDTRDSSKGTKEDSKTMTFTHLEIMRNQLNHMMQLANKDKEIHQLNQAGEDMKTKYSESLASKDNEIAKIKKVLQEVEFALSQAENKLASANEEHSKTIEVLMETQVEYHELELKTKSWMSPLLCFL
ncbi:MAG: hypothetical protein ACI90V_009202 [Bacillariaceae sp.]|jgi:hypothetical protein